MKTAIAFIVAVLVAAPVLAHSGGTDSKGCHYDHRTGVYHCH
ncbi:YHYH domain-containing protein [Quatrionicoccus australiensis]|nr:YHYH domain-containing protein [Quatrionicoccus australiensis]MCB4358460.1 YHYH domain-containing protein [Quatrionicoccus australiensis]